VDTLRHRPTPASTSDASGALAIGVWIGINLATIWPQIKWLLALVVGP